VQTYRTQGSLTKPQQSGIRALAAMREKGLDPGVRHDFIKRMARQPSGMHSQGKIECLGRGKAIRWRIARQ
jgi:hypothetical protein